MPGDRGAFTSGQEITMYIVMDNPSSVLIHQFIEGKLSVKRKDMRDAGEGTEVTVEVQNKSPLAIIWKSIGCQTGSSGAEHNKSWTTVRSTTIEPGDSKTQSATVHIPKAKVDPTVTLIEWDIVGTK
jgi:hypothetical protein